VVAGATHIHKRVVKSFKIISFKCDFRKREHKKVSILHSHTKLFLPPFVLSKEEKFSVGCDEKLLFTDFRS
jgi:hypothetical protein